MEDRLVTRVVACGLACLPVAGAAQVPALPEGARLAFEERWAEGKVDLERWGLMRFKWGRGNNGVVPENVAVVEDEVFGERRHVLRCRAHGDAYEGPVAGHEGRKTRVGGVAYTRKSFASGRYEVVMKIGGTEARAGEPRNPAHPCGAVPAVWTYGYRFVKVEAADKERFVEGEPLYNPLMPAYGGPCNEYWSELDFPEFGKGGDFTNALYNTFLQNRHDCRVFDAGSATDGRYHVLTTEWRTELVPLPGIRDGQVREAHGYFWICDKDVPFERYLGNPLKRVGKDEYLLYQGKIVEHWIDGKRVGLNDKWVPAMAAQLYVGVWLPEWAGPAPWSQADVWVASVRIWQYGDAGDVRGVLVPRVGE